MSNYIYTNDGLVNVDDLAHHGVKGMRWGLRKNRYAGVSTDGSKKRAAEKARQKLILAKRAKQADGRSAKVDTQYKAAKKAYKAAKKMANLEAKAVKQKYQKEYMKGASVAGKIYAKLTSSHKYYADTMYDINNGAYKPSK